jgi:hypothetical protein
MPPQKPTGPTNNGLRNVAILVFLIGLCAWAAMELMERAH